MTISIKGHDCIIILFFSFSFCIPAKGKISYKLYPSQLYHKIAAEKVLRPPACKTCYFGGLADARFTNRMLELNLGWIYLEPWHFTKNLNIASTLSVRKKAWKENKKIKRWWKKTTAIWRRNVWQSFWQVMLGNLIYSSPIYLLTHSVE